MDKTIATSVDIDLPGYLEGEHSPDCTEEVFDLHGRKVESWQ